MQMVLLWALWPVGAEDLRVSSWSGSSRPSELGSHFIACLRNTFLNL